MRIFVTTSDWYNPAAAAFTWLFNRYWSPRREVTLLCYTPPLDRLPDNFVIHSLGEPQCFGNEIREWMVGRRGRCFGEPYPTPKWTDSLRPFFEGLADPWFIFLQAAIWKTSYFLNLLKPGRSPWEFERLGMEEARNDGKLILGLDCRDKGPVAYLNVFGHGMVNWRQLCRLADGDLGKLKKLGYVGPHWNGWVEPPIDVCGWRP